MNNNISSIVVAAAVAILGVVMFVLGTTISLPNKQPEQPLGSATDNTYLEIPTATVVTIGKDIDTTLVATNTARAYLEISNISTSSPGQALYCNTNDRAAVLYSGFVIFASTTKVFNLDNLYRGALHCKYTSATSGVTVIER